MSSASQAAAATTAAVKVASSALFDGLIVGGGPAGLSAALSLARIRLRSIVFDSGDYRNKEAEEMHNVLSRDSMKPTEFLRLGAEQLDNKYSAFVQRRNGPVKGKIVSVDRVRIQIEDPDQSGPDSLDGFAAVDGDGNTTYSRKLVLATGSHDQLPDIEGAAENWPDHIFQCLFCDGFETYESKKPSGLLFADGLTAIAGHAAFLARQHTHPSQPVTIYTNGVPVPDDESLQKLVRTLEKAGYVFDYRPVTKLVNRGHGPDNGMDVHLGRTASGEAEEVVNVSFLLIRPGMKNQSDHLIESLGLTRHDPASGATGGEVVAKNVLGSSSVPGCFVAGDVIQPMLKQVVGAMNGGALAGAAVTGEIMAERKAWFEKQLSG